ncbi:metallophosphoesterase [Arenicella xantha]|uniref:Calcineurin-like phosphoesterase family protein n=1 Tax=Arenicella xantha TaxID=644221 RepID=A0A395JKB5_9GAMM|nr:metallophosphoesterase [Arenicella xantha]RBP51223.1 calcineurin-like phosphoesterase family protein [Arenicella xantha]
MDPHCNYVCLSDLHLGARYSILSSRNEHDLFDVDKPSDCLLELIKGLRQYIPKVYGDDLPKLVLLGDLVDFDFASMTDIVRSLDVLLRALFDDDEPDVFQKEVVFVPGNHDHHFWQSEKDNLFLERFQQDQYQSDERIPYQTTDLFRSTSLTSKLLDQLPYAKATGLSFEMRYPNWGLWHAGDDGHSDKQVVFHHGHYVEPLYRMMTTINQLMSDIGDPDIEELERQNGSWINFFWSSLGASPAQRDNTVLLFDIMQNPAATYRYSQRLASLVSEYLSSKSGTSPSNTIINNLTLEKLLAGIISSTLGRGFQAERANNNAALSEEGWEGLQWYLSKPLHQQILDDAPDSAMAAAHDSRLVLTDTTFIFGHTHKPFQDSLGVDGFQLPVKVFNSGGWVVDQPDFSSVQGGAVIFVDAQLNTASLRLFQAPVNGAMPPVTVEGAEFGSVADNDLLRRMQAQLDQTQWCAFQDSARNAMEQRAMEVRDQFFDRNSSDGVKQHGQ